MPQIKMVDLSRQYQSLKTEMDAALMAILNSTEFIMGPSVRGFEAALAQYLEIKHAIGCASGTDALQLALMAIDIRPGDEVLTTPFTFVATAETIVLLGGRPVFVDIEPGTFNLDPNLIEQKITLRSKAIIPVHLYGHPANLDPLLAIARKHHLKVIEDAAQAIGAKYQDKFVGGWGEIGCLSFFPSKNLGAYGDAGALLTNDDDLAGRLRLLMNHGSKSRYHHEILGVNSRLDSIQAAVLNVKLRHLEDWTKSRAKIAARYSAGLSGLPLSLPSCAPYARHVYNQYSIRTPRRDALARFLQERGIATAIHYPKPLHLQPAYRDLIVAGERFPQAELISQEILSLPIFPEMEETEVDFVIAAIREFFE